MQYSGKMARPEAKKVTALRRQLLEWYERHRRDLPWRRSNDPYAIWISEIMLQQTRVAAVVDRYHAFLDRFPTVESLAHASEDAVLTLWSGLGYYRRARMLHKAAQMVAVEHGGILPRTAIELRTLPGIGAYTSAAIASIACNEPVAVVDGNVERVLCRIEGWEGSATKSSALQKQVEECAERLLDPARPGDFNQAMMELGATICLPRNPQCLVCPIANHCATRGEHKTEPRKPMRSVEIGHGLVVRKHRLLKGKAREEVLLERRPSAMTVMPGLWELPALRDPEIPDAELCMVVRHAIMQVNYSVRIRNVQERDTEFLAENRGQRLWIPLEKIPSMPLTGLARKVLKKAKLWASPE